MKFKQFTTEELKEIASLIAGRELATARRDDILKELYDLIIIEIRQRRTIGPRAASHSALSPLSSAAFCAFSDNVRATTPKIDSDHATPATVAVVKGVTKLLTVADTLRAVIEAATISSASRSVC